MAKASGFNFWIGLTDRWGEGDFVWARNYEPVTYTDWLDGGQVKGNWPLTHKGLGNLRHLLYLFGWLGNGIWDACGFAIGGTWVGDRGFPAQYGRHIHFPLKQLKSIHHIAATTVKC